MRIAVLLEIRKFDRLIREDSRAPVSLPKTSNSLEAIDPLGRNTPAVTVISLHGISVRMITEFAWRPRFDEGGIRWLNASIDPIKPRLF